METVGPTGTGCPTVRQTETIGRTSVLQDLRNRWLMEDSTHRIIGWENCKTLGAILCHEKAPLLSNDDNRLSLHATQTRSCQEGMRRQEAAGT